MVFPFAFTYATFVPASEVPPLPLPCVSNQLIFLALFWWTFRKDLGAGGFPYQEIVKFSDALWHEIEVNSKIGCKIN